MRGSWVWWIPEPHSPRTQLAAGPKGEATLCCYMERHALQGNTEASGRLCLPRVYQLCGQTEGKMRLATGPSKVPLVLLNEQFSFKTADTPQRMGLRCRGMGEKREPLLFDG